MLDEHGVPFLRATLGDTPLADAADLYWAELEAIAPPDLRGAAWSIVLSDDGLPIAHVTSAFVARFVTSASPDASMTVRVVDAATRAGIAGAEVRLRSRDDSPTASFAGTTDAAGTASISAPSRTYEIQIWRHDYRAQPHTASLQGSAEMEIAAEHTPKKKQAKVWM